MPRRCLIRRQRPCYKFVIDSGLGDVIVSCAPFTVRSEVWTDAIGLLVYLRVDFELMAWMAVISQRDDVGAMVQRSLTRARR